MVCDMKQVLTILLESEHHSTLLRLRWLAIVARPFRKTGLSVGKQMKMDEQWRGPRRLDLPDHGVPSGKAEQRELASASRSCMVQGGGLGQPYQMRAKQRSNHQNYCAAVTIAASSFSICLNLWHSIVCL